jgi:hypothetical protein
MRLGELTLVNPSDLKDGNIIIRFPNVHVGVVGKPERQSDGRWEIKTLELETTGPGTIDYIHTDKPVVRVDYFEDAARLHEEIHAGKAELELSVHERVRTTSGDLTLAAVVTLENDQPSVESIGLQIRSVYTDAAAWAEDKRFRFRLDEEIGRRICVGIGERIWAYDQDSPQALLWLTFMGHVHWAEVGKHFRERVHGDELPDGWTQGD